MADFNKLFDSFQKQRETIDYQMPSKKRAEEFIEELVNFLFPINQGRNFTKLEAEIIFEQLQYRFKELLLPIKHLLKEDVEKVTCDFFESITSIYIMLINDAKTIHQFDPAASCCEEVIVAYPGFFAITIYRFTHQMNSQNIPIIQRLIGEYAHSKTGIDIHPGATIGENFFIDHGTGVVIGETAIIKNNVKIYQGVTLGALSVSKDLAETKRHPTIEDNVVIYAGSTILGGKTLIGHDSIIGGNCWVTKSVEPYTVVTNISETKSFNHKEFTEAINFVI